MNKGLIFIIVSRHPEQKRDEFLCLLIIDLIVLHDRHIKNVILKMQRARMISTPLPKGTKTNLRLRSWGMERAHKTTRGNEICTAAPFESQRKINRKFKILTSDLIELGYIG